MKQIIYVAREVLDESFGGSVVAQRNLKALQSIFGEENVVEFRTPKTSMHNVLPSMLRLGSYGIPLELENHICDYQRKNKVEYAFIEGSMASTLVKKLSRQGCKVAVFAHNVEKNLYRQRHLKEKTPLSWVRYHYVRLNEGVTARHATYIISLNERDAEGFISEYGRKPDLILPITFPNHSDSCVDAPHEGRPYLLFVGSDFFPNVEGIRWFIENVAPHVGRFRICVVGGCCKNEAVAAMALPTNVELSGYVDNLNSYYRDASAVIAPIFSGSGMKTKTIEALSYGKTVFGTPEAFAGVKADFSKLGGMCETAEEFINRINAYDGGRINPYSLELFRSNFSDESFLKGLKSIFSDTDAMV